MRQTRGSAQSGRQSWFTRSRERPARRLGTGPRVGRSCRDSGCSACCVGRTPRGPRGIQQIQGDASARVRDVVELRRTDASVLPRRRGSSRRRGDRHRRPRVQGLVRRKARHAPARPLSARGRARRSRWSPTYCQMRHGARPEKPNSDCEREWKRKCPWNRGGPSEGGSSCGP